MVHSSPLINQYRLTHTPLTRGDEDEGTKLSKAPSTSTAVARDSKGDGRQPLQEVRIFVHVELAQSRFYLIAVPKGVNGVFRLLPLGKPSALQFNDFHQFNDFPPYPTYLQAYTHTVRGRMEGFKKYRKIADCVYMAFRP